MAQFVTLVNRSSKDLIGTWDGKHTIIKPGKHEFPDYKAFKFKDQNPVMGSEDVRTGHVDYLIGIVEEGDPLDPIEQNPDAIEKWNRKTMGNARPTEVVAGANGLYSRNDLAPGPGSAGPVTSGFDKR